MAELKALTALAEEWKLSKGHLDAVVAFEKIEPIHSYNAGTGKVHLYDPDMVREANGRYVQKKLQEERAEAERRRIEEERRQPLTKADLGSMLAIQDGLAAQMRSITDDMANVFTAADDAKASTANLLEQNKLIFKRLGDIQDLITTRFGALERMVGAYAKPADEIASPGAALPPSPPAVRVMAPRAPAPEPEPPAPRLMKVVDAEKGLAMTAAAGAAAVMTGAMEEATREQAASTKGTRPKVAILGCLPKRIPSVSRDFSASFDLAFYHHDDAQPPSFTTKVGSLDAIFVMTTVIGVMPRTLNGIKTPVIKVPGSMSGLKTKLAEFWTLHNAEALGRVNSANVARK